MIRELGIVTFALVKATALGSAPISRPNLHHFPEAGETS